MSFNIPNNQYVDIAKNAVVTGVIGACASVPINYAVQKTMIKHSDFWIDKFEKSISKCKTQKSADTYEKAIEYLKNNKVSFKNLGKTALYTGLIFGGCSLIYNLIKSLFVREEKVFI